MSSRASRTQGQQQQQQAAMFTMPHTCRSTASTSRMRPSSGMTSQQSPSGVQGGSRSEPLRPRPSYPAPSTIMPDDSASGLGYQTVPTRDTRRSVNHFDNNFYNVPRTTTAPRRPVASEQIPQGIPQMTPSSFIGVGRASENQYAPSSFRPTPQSNVSATSRFSAGRQQAPSSFASGTRPRRNEGVAPSQRSGPTAMNYQYPPPFPGPNEPSIVRGTAAPSTARLASQPPSGLGQSFTGGTATRSRAGMSTGAISRNQPMNNSTGLPLNSHGPQPSPGINVGFPLGSQMQFNYNQVDNRQLHISNNAPQKVVTNNNQVYNTDNSYHHNTHAPQANTYNIQATNAGNRHTHVSQKAHRARHAAP